MSAVQGLASAASAGRPDRAGAGPRAEARAAGTAPRQAAAPAEAEARQARPAAARLPVSKPVGESGASLRHVNVGNSFLRMFLLETSHLPAQRRRSHGAGAEVLAQDVALRVMVLPGGTPVAVGGSAQTQSRSDDGRLHALRELAYVSFLRRLNLAGAGLATGAGTQTMPLVRRQTDSWSSALEVLRDRRTLLAAEPREPAELLRNVSLGALRPMIQAFDRLAGALGGLEEAFGRLSDRQSLVPAAAASSAPLYLSAEALPGVRPGSWDVEVLRLARGHAVRSAEMAAGPLGLSGSFALGGVEISVAAGDSLFDLAARINRGEDLDGDGGLDAGEDLDGDGRLSGGTAAHGVHAGFYEGRLRLERVDATAGEIDVGDGDGILQAIGLVALDGNGQYVFPDQVAAAQSAAIRVGGTVHYSPDNTFREAVPGAALELRGLPPGTVRVTASAQDSPAAAAVGRALEAFNAAMAEMNSALGSSGGVLARDPAATRVRAELVKALIAPVPGRPADLDEAAEAGVERARRRRAVFSELQMASAARAERLGQPRSALARAEDPPSVHNALDELGIVGAGDDTFRLDGERFARALASRPEDLGELFADATEGIAARVLRRLDSALGPAGLLALRRTALEALASARLGQKYAPNFAPDPRIGLLRVLEPAPGE